ncbi:glycoside hydrolase family 3 protein [uncultured Ruminococcus sp.]|uniref:glycoside hydrolase family 3 protein n=1 Tax=uncultured Ruminococcus sp. TaxID=165186 RepID=UPI0026004A08|nr:glycoside hydrolase family 3 protein [uncultured Ruminococcus sp.]
MRSRIMNICIVAVMAAALSSCGNTGGNSDTSAAQTADTEAQVQTEAASPEAAAEKKSPEELLAGMTVEEKVYQLFVVTPEALTGFGQVTQAGDATKSSIEEKPVGGLIYFAQNLETKEQTTEMLTTVQQYAKARSGMGMLLAVDEEGGMVARCADTLGTTAFEGMMYYGDKGDTEEAYNIGKTIGTDIKGLGFNLDFAPVADVDLCEENELADRCFSSDPYVVAGMVEKEIAGFHDAGIPCTLKHFPGLGAESGNSHEDTQIIIDRSLEQLREEEFVPFKRGIDAGADLVMVGHQQMTGVGDGLPSDLSNKVITEILRGELGFNGVVVTDSQQMNTITDLYSPSEAAVLSIKAGADIILMPDDLDAAFKGVTDAVRSGDIAESRIDESVMRILKLKEKYGMI